MELVSQSLAKRVFFYGIYFCDRFLPKKSVEMVFVVGFYQKKNAQFNVLLLLTENSQNLNLQFWCKIARRNSEKKS